MPAHLLDSIDRDILRLLLGAGRPLSCHSISLAIRLSDPATKARLSKLHSAGILRIASSGKTRTFSRSFFGKTTQKVSSPSRTLWEIDLVVPR